MKTTPSGQHWGRTHYPLTIQYSVRSALELDQVHSAVELEVGDAADRLQGLGLEEEAAQLRELQVKIGMVQDAVEWEALMRESEELAVKLHDTPGGATVQGLHSELRKANARAVSAEMRLGWWHMHT